MLQPEKALSAVMKAHEGQNRFLKRKNKRMREGLSCPEVSVTSVETGMGVRSGAPHFDRERVSRSSLPGGEQGVGAIWEDKRGEEV